MQVDCERALMNMKKILIYIVAVCALAAACMSCSPGGQPVSVVTPSPIVLPSATAAPVATPDATAQATASAEPGSAQAQDTVAPQNEQAVAAYLPAANTKLTAREYLGKQTPELVGYVFAVKPDVEDPAYAVSAFYAEQSFYYISYYIDQEGIWAQASEEGSEKYLVLPATLEEGYEFTSGKNACVIAKTGADFDMGGYEAANCVIVQSASTAYSTDVYKVYQPGVGLIAEYIIYGSDETDLLHVASKVESITQEEADAVIKDSTF